MSVNVAFRAALKADCEFLQVVGHVDIVEKADLVCEVYGQDDSF